MENETLFNRPGGEPSGRIIDYRAELNPAQYEAVTTLDGPMLVVAGAGSGKTRTLVYRVAYLVEQGVPPESILLLTFTRKAAAEMLARAEKLVGARCARVSGGTFHSLAHELLRRWAGRLGYESSFGVMDRGDMEEVIGQLRKQSGMGEGDRKFPKRGTVAEIISKCVNKSLSLEELMVRDYVHLMPYQDDIHCLASEYTVYKAQHSLMDFDDLLLLLLRLLKKHPEARQAISGQYQYIMVDEYQDTNLIQAEIVYLLASERRNVMAVGDDAQSIYSFRGASFKNIMDFPRHFPGTTVVRLEENYRSRQPILDLTNHIISRAREKYDKRLFTRRGGGEHPRLVVLATEKEQSLFVCRRIRELMAEGIEPSRMAVLFRAASHSFDLEVELMRHDIDFVKYGGRKFLEAAHIKDLLSLLRVVANPSDGVSLTRALMLMEGVGPKSAGQVVAWVGADRDRLLTLDQYPARGKLKDALPPLAGLFKQIGPKGLDLQQRIAGAWNFYRPLMEVRFDDHPKRATDIAELLRIARGYTNLTRFLTDMALEPPNTTTPRPGQGNESGRLILSTVHSAKGLEWDVVFIIWATEGRFPPIYALRNPDDLDEERRLLYVAATRAKDLLYIISPLEGDAWGGAMAQPRLSRFLSDLPPQLVGAEAEPEPEFSPPVNHARPSVAPAVETAGGFSPGRRVTHPVFGLGRVLDIRSGNKIVIDFDHFGTKTLHLDYAGLKPAGS